MAAIPDPVSVLLADLMRRGMSFGPRPAAVSDTDLDRR